MEGKSPVPLERVDECRWIIPRHGEMRTHGLVFASEAMMESLRDDAALEQVRNVAHLPGIVGPSLAMPDIHWGYGFPIGGVAAMDPENGVVSPGGIGYDINCGVRLLRVPMHASALKGEWAARLVKLLAQRIPAGVGSSRGDLVLSRHDELEAVTQGARWAVGRGFGRREDLEHIEEGGRIGGARPDVVSERAFVRGQSQLGTIGSGNHFVEVGAVDRILDERLARGVGLEYDQLTVIIHTGSRGFGYQVCEDSIHTMLEASRRYGITLPDRQLCCAPLASPEAERYLGAMACAANYAFNNRQIITHWVREALNELIGQEVGTHTSVVYDLCHNIGKFEEHLVGGRPKRVFVHRKGATRAFPPRHPQTPAAYRDVGQPVLVPGDMGRYSFVLCGTDRAYRETFGSSCHGAGRLLSRTQAKKVAHGRQIEKELAARGIHVRGASRATVAEEIPEAYKDVADVVQVVERAGIAKLVARLRPIAVTKG